MKRSGLTFISIFVAGEKATCVLVRGAMRHGRTAMGIGTTIPMHASAAGKIFLAYMPEYERESIIKKTGLKAYTTKTITDPEILDEELMAIRLRGYAVNDCECDEEVSIASPIFGFGDKIVGVVSIAGEPSRLTDRQIKKLIQPLIKYGQLLSEMVHNVII